MLRGWLAAAVVLAATSSARAEVEIVSLRYQAPAECPGRDAVIAQIQDRTAAAQFADSAPRVFAIAITASADGFTGTLVVDATADKRLTAGNCEDLVSALALVTALAIDPMAVTAPTASPRSRGRHPIHLRERLPPHRPRRRFRGWQLDASAGATVDAGVTPDPLVAAALHARGGWDTYGRLGRVAIELGLLAGRDSTTMDDGARAAFTWVTARPAACLVRGRRLEVAGCGHLELGLVRAGAEDVINGRDLNRLWWTTGVHGELRWPVTSRGFGQLQLGMSVPIVRDRYRLNPGIVVHETAPITGWLGVGVGMRFW